MTDESAPPQLPQSPQPVDLEERGIDPGWVAVGLSAASLGLQAYQTFKPGGQQPPPPADPPPPQIELPPGADQD